MFSRKKKILIIDDEKDLCFFIRGNLKLLGNYEVLIANDGKRGFFTAMLHRPDLILLDIMMPGLNGFEVLQRLKGNARTISIPVMMITAKNDEEFKLKAAELYNHDYIVKPFEIKVLKSKIDAVLKKSPSNHLYNLTR